MPYIKSEARLRLAKGAKPTSAGELNYLFTKLIDEYCDNVGFKYQTANDVIGALESCKLEFYRRVMANYEDRKIVENGEVYGGLKL